MKHCKICLAELKGPPLIVKEEMYGSGEIFEYGQCSVCGCLQILDVPKNLSKYYPKVYHGHISPELKRTWKALRRGLKRKLILEHPNWLSPLVRVWLSSIPMFWIYRRLGMQIRHKVLDVGAGYGGNILEILSAGVEQAIGVDLFIEQDIWLRDKLLVKKGTIDDIHDSFDIILFHHSLEHMPDQMDTLRKARALLREGGKILVRIPTVSSQAFLEYKEKWYQLDAPRHLFLHSHESFRRLAEAAKLIILDKWCDSSELQFLTSEQYRRGISSVDPKSYTVNKHASGFTPQEIREFKQKANLANQSLAGDQICFVLSMA